MPKESIFSTEWRDCLCAHYTYVLRNRDAVTERTLRGVMINAGFTEGELKELYVLATAHVDDVGADFVPDAEFLEQDASASVSVAVAMPQEAITAMLVEEAVALDESANQAAADVEAETAADSDEDTPDDTPPDDSGITQLSLF